MIFKKIATHVARCGSGSTLLLPEAFQSIELAFSEAGGSFPRGLHKPDALHVLTKT